ncbi:unnamed protein product [Callosobruchus maculatus]|uniref:YqaJ viral recombinase domain-containing protein n=1 Tax=Callosobruchus maculatus TaxID=64391 RepID=A0A653CTH9_CALMS|nr:unnamed protein product [Callosobruchus maculatus]VEN51062.1 unnamed protein product [Callosobruchus maculatus]
MANLVLDMPCVKAAVPRRDVFLNPNDQMRRNLYLNTLLKIYQTLLLQHRKGRIKNPSELDTNTTTMPTENIEDEYGHDVRKSAREAFVSKTGHIIVDCGMIESAGNKWLGFSPDGVVLNLNREAIALLEIKCLY